MQSLACNTALSQGSQIIALLEERGEGIQWDNMDQKVLYTELTFDWMLAFMVFDGIIDGLIGWYASNVFPRKSCWPARFFTLSSFAQEIRVVQNFKVSKYCMDLKI